MQRSYRNNVAAYVAWQIFYELISKHGSRVDMQVFQTAPGDSVCLSIHCLNSGSRFDRPLMTLNLTQGSAQLTGNVQNDSLLDERFDFVDGAMRAPLFRDYLAWIESKVGLSPDAFWPALDAKGAAFGLIAAMAKKFALTDARFLTRMLPSLSVQGEERRDARAMIESAMSASADAPKAGTYPFFMLETIDETAKKQTEAMPFALIDVRGTAFMPGRPPVDIKKACYAVKRNFAVLAERLIERID